MLEKTLVCLGNFLKEGFGTQYVYYCDKSAIFKKLSEDRVGLNFPAISYYDSTVKFNQGRGSFVTNHNTNFTVGTKTQPVAIELNISLGIITNNLEDHYRLAKNYLLMKYNSVLEISYIHEGEEIIIDSAIKEFSELTSPPEGKEGYDYDRSIYYAREGSFTINTLLLLSSEYQLVRRINSEVDF